MPTIPAAGYAYQPFPTERPSLQAPQPFQRIQATPEAFGAAEGEALGRLGKAAEGVGDTSATRAVEIQNQFNTTAAREASNRLQEAINNRLYGNPDKPGDVGFIGLQGRAAMDAYPAFRAAMRDLVKEQRAVLQNDQQRLRFDADVDNFVNYKMSESGRHYTNEMNQWNIATAQGTAKLAAGDAARAAAMNDPVLFDTSVSRGSKALEEALTKAGQPPESVRAAVDAFKSSSADDWARSLATRDPVAAQKFAEANRGLLGEKFASVMDHVRARAQEREAQSLANRTSGVKGKAPPPAIFNEGVEVFRRRGWSDAAIEGAFNNIQDESEFNPYKVNPKGGEKGLFQFHPGSHQPTFDKKYSGNWAARNQFEYVADWIDANMPEYKNITDPRAATAAFLRGFEKPADQSDAVVERRFANRLAPTATPAPTVAAQVAAIEQSDAPPEVKDRAIALTRQRANAEHADEVHRRQAAEAVDKVNDDSLETEYNRRIAAKDPSLTAQAILGDLRWRNPNAAQRMMSFFERSTKADPDPGVSAKNQVELFRRMIAADDDEGKIRTREPLDQAYVKQEITWGAHQELVKELTRRIAGTSQADVTRELNAAIRAVRPIIRPLSAFPEAEALSDKTAGQRELEFLQDTQARIRALIEAGRDPRVLFQPLVGGKPNPEYVLNPERLQLFKPQENLLPNGLQDTPGQKKAAAPKMDLSTQAGIAAAYRAGLISREVAKQRLIELGVKFTDDDPKAPPVR